MIILSTFVFLRLIVTGSGTVGSCSETGSAPRHAATHCIIESRESGICSLSTEDGVRIHECDDSIRCPVWTGMPLDISCSNGDSSLTLYRRNSSLGSPVASWPFAVSTAVEGTYECRWANGSLFANRSVTVDDTVYVIPGFASYTQRCRVNIVPEYNPGFNCSVGHTLLRYSVWPDDQHTIPVQFNVLGARPIDISVDVVWFNHYPVDLHPSYNPVANTSTILHNVELDTDDLWFVGDNDFVKAYVVITANSSTSSYTMCAPVELHGVSLLFPGVSFPKELGVSAAESVYFPCQVWSEPADGASFTIAISVWDPSLGDMRQCINCSFSATTELTECAVSVPGTERGCSGMQFLKSSYNDSTLPTQTLRHNLTAYWSEVGAQSHKVTCAVAARGVIQWAYTATITVTESFPKEVTVYAGELASFPCLVQRHASDRNSFTVAISVRDPSLSDVRQCMICRFSATEPLYECGVASEDGSNRGCSFLQFLHSSFGHPTLQHNLTAYWSEVDSRRNGNELICTVASQGGVQWNQTATLTVLPSSSGNMTFNDTSPLPSATLPLPSAALPLPSDTSSLPGDTPTLDKPTDKSEGLADHQIVALTTGIVAALVVCIAILCTAGVLFWCSYRQRKSTSIVKKNDENEEFLGDVSTITK